MRHFRTPTVCASKYPSRAAKKYVGGTRAIAERTVFNGRKCSSTPRTARAAIHRKAMIVQPRALRRVRFASIMKGESQREGYRKTQLRLLGACGRVSTREQQRAAIRSIGEDFVDFARKREIAIADAVDIMRIEIDHDFVPHVEPFGMMIQGFGRQRDAGHLAERGHEILAREFAMEFAVYQRPILARAEAFVDFFFR